MVCFIYVSTRDSTLVPLLFRSFLLVVFMQTKSVSDTICAQPSELICIICIASRSRYPDVLYVLSQTINFYIVSEIRHIYFVKFYSQAIRLGQHRNLTGTVQVNIII